MAADRPILIVEDEEDLRNLLDLHLRREGYDTMLAATGQEALAAVDAQTPALVVLDLMLPDLSGTEVCRRLRARPDSDDMSIIMLTARGEEIDRVVGFEVGADDYVVKSTFSVREFMLRVRAVLRRFDARRQRDAAPSSEPKLVFGELRLSPAEHRAVLHDKEIPLTVTEFRLLHALCSRPDRVQSRGTLLEDVWDMSPELETRTVDTHVKRLREKLGTAARFVETVRGVGYRFSPNKPAPGDAS